MSRLFVWQLEEPVRRLSMAQLKEYGKSMTTFVRLSIATAPPFMAI